jgi:ABC-2 type transport system ATP-binding protein
MIEATGLTKSYGSRRAVDDISFVIRPGIVTGFLGPNGAGKSTTMRLMLELDRGPGRTLFDGTPYRNLRHPMRMVGALLEAKAFHPTRSARNHLRMLGVANGIDRKRVDEVLEIVGLQSVATKKPKGFSLGMGQRLGLAAALLGQPDTLILDEPANGLDPQGITWLRDFLRAYAGEGRTVFVSSHLLAEMNQLAEHVIVIGRGRIIADAPMADFVAASSRTSIIVRSPGINTLREELTKAEATATVEPDGALSVTGLGLAEIGDLALSLGVAVHELSLRTATLEEAYLEVTGGSEEFAAMTPQAAAGFGTHATGGSR